MEVQLGTGWFRAAFTILFPIHQQAGPIKMEEPQRELKHSKTPRVGTEVIAQW